MAALGLLYPPRSDGGSDFPERVAATRATLAALPTDRPIYLAESGREGNFVWSSVNESARVTRDPLQGMTVAGSADPTGSAGAWLRVGTDPMCIDARHFGYRDDRVVDKLTGAVSAEGTEAGTILNAIIAYCEPSDDKFVPGSGQVAKNGSYRVMLCRVEGGTGLVRHDVRTVIPSDKQVLFDGGRCGSIVHHSPTEDYAFEFFNHGQGASFGVCNLMLWGGAIRVIGGSQGVGMDLHHLIFLQNRQRGIHTIDRRDYEPGYSSVAPINVTQAEWSHITSYGGAGLLDWEATTYANCKLRRLRAYASTSTPIRITGKGLTFEDLEFIGIAEAAYATSAFIHLDPQPGGTVSDIAFQGDVRFGSEDSVTFDELFQPPRVLVQVGPFSGAWDSTTRASHLTFDGVAWNAAHATSNANGSPFLEDGVTPNPSYAPVRAGIKINCRSNNITITGGSRDELADALIDDSVARANGWSTYANVLDIPESANATGNIFSDNALGWAVRAPTRHSRIPIRPRVRFASPGDSTWSYQAQDGYMIEDGGRVRVNLHVEFMLTANTTAPSSTNFVVEFDVLNSDGSLGPAMPGTLDTIIPSGQVMNAPLWAGFDIGSSTREIAAVARFDSIRLTQTRDANSQIDLTASIIPLNTPMSLDIVGEYWTA